MIGMQYDSPNRSVVLTGASSGIGEACAVALTRAGWRVFAGVLTPEEGESLQRKCGDRLATVVLDVTDAASIEAARATVADAVGEDGLSALVNNAGISVTAPLEIVPIAELKRQLDVNVVGPIAVSQAFLPLLRAGRGRIVNTGSAFGWISIPFLGPYSASKAALARLTGVLRLELREWGIHVALVAPGPVATPIWQNSAIAAFGLAATMSDEGRELYDWPGSMSQVARIPEMRNRIDAARVVRAVCHALSSSKPRDVYLVGSTARAIRAADGPRRPRTRS